ncbi:anhydro-N-acetylmuramic acid kinase [Oxalobacteraceae bacterium CAVE-383]|nr:anhydro-N-acetylmuramic acid kinase [Oxalobacteraceae bacterium CAVE-383]
MAAPATALSALYIGLMSGTSLDGVDGVLAAFPTDDAGNPNGTSDASRIATLATAYIPFDDSLRAALMALQSGGPDEIHREALVAAQLARHYAECVAQLRPHAGAEAVAAIGVHGQTIRHRPELGYTRQTNNPALLAELSGIDVIADFRSRDVAAGGQGAPLAPAFHRAVFGSPQQTRAVVNIGGFGNITILPAAGAPDAIGAIGASGFDTGPGNVLMDVWIARHQNRAYDENGAWAASGKVHEALLKHLLDEAFFALPAPKSTGRDLFHPAWLEHKLQAFAGVPAADVQATLAALTAATIAQAIAGHAPDVAAVYVCGGGAHNGHLMQALAQALASALQCEPGRAPAVQSTAVLGVAPNHVEALAFAWLAQRFTHRLPGNVPAVTGAAGPRVLGALYPA